MEGLLLGRCITSRLAFLVRVHEPPHPLAVVIIVSRTAVARSPASASGITTRGEGTQPGQRDLPRD